MVHLFTVSTASNRLAALATLVVVNISTACGGSDTRVTADDCIVYLHGKGDSGSRTILDASVALISPDGNGEGWGAREWRYAQPADLATGIEIIAGALTDHGCRRAAVHGFSNGAAFAAAMYCSGERLDGRLVGVVVDDPVTDDSVADCSPDPAVLVALYWTGALPETGPPGSACRTLDWTCAGEVVRAIDDYAIDLGVTVTASPFDEHRWHLDALEPRRWLSDASSS